MASGIMELIDQLYTSISDAKGFPLSGEKCILNRDNALDLLEEIRSQLPAEVAEAKRLMSAKADVIRKTKEEAEQIRSDAEQEAADLLSQQSITLAAQQKAQDLLTDAEQRSGELKKAASVYADDMLRKAEETLTQLLEGVRRNRSSFQEASGYTEE